VTRLINIDNGGTLTDVCVVDGDGVRYTKTLTTPFDLSRCLFDGLTKASRLVYGEERLAALLQATDYIRYSTTQGTNALVQRQGPRLGLLAALDAPPSGRSQATWFDSLAYCRAKLMSYGPVPWDSPGEVTAFFGKAQGMFRSDALLVDLGDLLAWRVGHDGLLRTAMASRSRPSRRTPIPTP